MSNKYLVILSSIIMCFIFFNTSHTYASSSTQIVKTANEHIGTPYRFGGNTPAGFDCSGFIYYVFSKNEITLPRTASGQYQAGSAVNKSDLQVGDLVFFETYKPGPSHSGIYVGNSQFIHSSSSRGIMISSINDPHYWASRYLGAKRVLTAEPPLQQLLSSLPEGHFLDIPESHWAFQDIKSLANDGIVSGVKEGIFEPNAEVTRAQVAAVLASVINIPMNDSSLPFTDVPASHWAAKSIQTTSNAGYFVNISDKFEPNLALTRAELANILSIAFELDANGEMISYSDVSTSHWAYSSINRIAAHGYMTGFTDSTYRPNEKVTRAQFAKVLNSILQK